MPNIHLKNITKKYGTQSIIHNLNLKIHDNNFTVFIGPSGCGKSTLLRLISGLESVTSGEIYIDQKNVTFMPPKERNLSMVFQDYALYPHMNIYDNIGFALTLKKMDKTKIDQKVLDISSTMGLDNLLMHKPSELSGGQRQRVAMARALVRDTPLILLDEPLSNLDSQLRTTLRKELVRLKQKINRNMIYVTHDQIEAMTLADQVVVLNKGKIQQYDSPKNLYAKPKNLFVAQFLGSPNINTLKASIINEKDQLYLQNDAFKIRLNQQQHSILKNYTHDTIHIGIRPHDFKIASDRNAQNFFKCTYQMQEFVGARHIISMLCGDQSIQIEINAETTPKHFQETFNLECCLEKLHFFDIITGDTLD